LLAFSEIHAEQQQPAQLNCVHRVVPHSFPVQLAQQREWVLVLVLVLERRVRNFSLPWMKNPFLLDAP